MSDQTRRDLAEAISAHVADELDDALTGAVRGADALTITPTLERTNR